MPKLIIEFNMTDPAERVIALKFSQLLTGRSEETISVDERRKTTIDIANLVHKDTVKKFSESEKTIGKKAKGKWSRKYDACLGCHSTKRRHIAKGLCTTCYFGGRPSEEETADERQNRIADEHEVMGMPTCSNPNCPYDARDYLGQKMVKGKSGKEYCDPLCRSDCGDTP